MPRTLGRWSHCALRPVQTVALLPSPVRRYIYTVSTCQGLKRAAEKKHSNDRMNHRWRLIKILGVGGWETILYHIQRVPKWLLVLNSKGNLS